MFSGEELVLVLLLADSGERIEKFCVFLTAGFDARCGGASRVSSLWFLEQFALAVLHTVRGPNLKFLLSV